MAERSAESARADAAALSEKTAQPAAMARERLGAAAQRMRLDSSSSGSGSSSSGSGGSGGSSKAKSSSSKAQRSRKARSGSGSGKGPCTDYFGKDVDSNATTGTLWTVADVDVHAGAENVFF